MMELHARPEPKKGHEDTVSKIELRITESTALLNKLWTGFLEEHGFDEPTIWPSKKDRLFRELTPESEPARQTIMDSLEELDRHMVMPMESAQAHAILISLRGQTRISQIAEQSLFLKDDFSDIIQDALQYGLPESNENVIRLNRTRGELKNLSAEDLIKIESYAIKLLDTKTNLTDKLPGREELEYLASWCSYWGNLGHGSDVYFDDNCL